MTQPHLPGARVGIVGASTLRGKELQAVLRERRFPVSKMVLMDSDEDLGHLSEFEGEPAVSLAISEGSFEFLDLVFFAGNPASAVSYARLGADRNFVAIDLTNALSKDRQFPLFLEVEKGKKPSITPIQGVICSPHPAAISVALVLQRLSSKYQIRHSVISIFEPASERGNMGVEELEKQTLNIFSFHKGPEVVFNRQLAFNLLSRLGEEAKERLIDGEEAIAHQLRVLLSNACPLPALTLIQAPVFHSHSFSIFVEMEQKVSVTEVENLLDSENLTVIRSADEPPSPAQVAGMDTIQIGGIKGDFLNSNGLWFWAASDNLRLAAINAVAAAEAVFLP
jgi:aspartate-semialdehyde dehydrogenase